MTNQILNSLGHRHKGHLRQAPSSLGWIGRGCGSDRPRAHTVKTVTSIISVVLPDRAGNQAGCTT
jgi:hypothetical protein